MDLVARPPPFLCQTDYESVFKYNQDAINNLLDLVSSMCSANPFLKGELHLQLALFVVNCYQRYRKPQGEYIIDDKSCSLCNSEQTVNITFLYKGMGNHSTLTRVYSTTLDGWNLLNYYEAQVEFQSFSGIPYPLKHFYSPIIGFYEDEYLHPEV